jgi:predicted CoA-binding protein
MTTAERIDAFLAQPALALVGASGRTHHFGNAALRTLRDKGYRVYPIHRRAAQIDGVKCHSRFDELPEPVGGVVIVVPPPQAVDVIHAAARAGITRVWLQQGAESLEALNECDRLGLDVVAGECILMFANPTGIHRAHRFVANLLHRIPA